MGPVSDNKKPPGDSGRDPGDLVPQPHGGALKRGGNYGNKGGRRETSRVRDRLTELRDDTLDELQEKLKAGNLSDSDAIKLASLAAKYTLRAVAYAKDLIDELWDATEGVLLKVDDPAVIEKVKRAWVPVLASRIRGGSMNVDFDAIR